LEIVRMVPYGADEFGSTGFDSSDSGHVFQFTPNATRATGYNKRRQ
jgi:hypothetical protein